MIDNVHTATYKHMNQNGEIPAGNCPTKRSAERKKLAQILEPLLSTHLNKSMYIEFQLPRKDSNNTAVQLGRESLLNELKRWSKQHNLDYYAIKTDYIYGDNLERVYLPSDRAYELFLISWAPKQQYFGDYKLRKN